MQAGAGLLLTLRAKELDQVVALDITGSTFQHNTLQSSSAEDSPSR